MADVAVITSIYGGYDRLTSIIPQRDLSVDWVLVTDKPLSDSKGWRVIIHNENLPNRMMAKLPKVAPWDYTSAPISVWVDGSFVVTSDTFVSEAISSLSDKKPIAQFKHVWRDCLYEEADTRLGMAKDASVKSLIEQQVLKYRSVGHPEHWGLWASGVMARIHTQSVKDLSDFWFQEITEFSSFDQISQPYVLRELGLRPLEFPGTYFSNSWIRYEGSGNH